MNDAVQVQCPYCWQLQEIYVEADLGGELVQDCEVCCNPWSVFIERGDEGELTLVAVDRAQ